MLTISTVREIYLDARMRQEGQVGGRKRFKSAIVTRLGLIGE